MAVELLPPKRCQPRPHAAAALAERSFDRDVPGLLERRQLFRQRRVGEAELVADEREVRPVGSRQQGDDREACGGVDELVEACLVGHCVAARRVARSRIQAITRGPPSRSRIAAKTLAQIEGCSAPSASSVRATATVTPTSARRKPITTTCV